MGTRVRSGLRHAPVVRAAVAAVLVAVGATVLVGLGHAEESSAQDRAAAAPASPAAPRLEPPTRSAPAQDGPRRPAADGAHTERAGLGTSGPDTAGNAAARDSGRAEPQTEAPRRLRASAPRPESTPRRAVPNESGDASSDRSSRAGRGAAVAAGGRAVDGGPPPVAGTPCSATARACVSLHDRKAWLIDGGKIFRGPVPIRPGDAVDPTPRGTFAVQWKAEEYTSREYLTQMPYAAFFADGGIAFHEGTFDTPSAGCVKLGHDDARAFFYFLQVGDQVQIH
jgi:lipoprotein-anchoring transpeptidase ErfK/SrfK